MTLLSADRLRSDHDVIAVRRKARYVAELLGYSHAEQIRIAAVVFELAHDVFRHAFHGAVEFQVPGALSVLRTVFKARGENTPVWQQILETRRRGVDDNDKDAAMRALLEEFEIDAVSDDTAIVCLDRPLPSHDDMGARIAHAVQVLAEGPAFDVFDEVRLQNQELVQALGEANTRQLELRELGRELEDTNRGVVALYAELEDKAQRLRQADAMKSRFLSNMSHEFRTPLGSISALTQLLLDRLDGSLSSEQEKQVRLIQKSTGELMELVNDLLDLAKIEAGKVDVRHTLFSVRELLSALRGMFGPMLTGRTVKLELSIAPGLDTVCGDDGKIAQILRNFISNALKFTEHGCIEIRAEGDAQQLRFTVADTGIGIASHHLGLIFEEFTQLENPLQQHVRGTGLGLPLCRQLARLLGGDIAVSSVIGEGSTFTLTVPVAPAAAA